MRHYPSLTDDPLPPSGAYAHFRKFCLAHEDEIRKIMATRLVQTNVVERCSYLLPAFALIAEEVPGTPLSLIDVGASAGLSLLWDRYQYVYGGRIRAGLASSPVRIEAEVRGKGTPPIPHDFPTVAHRAGIDLHPVDMADPESALWLRALNWPEHQDRAAQLQAAIALVQDDAPELIEGDANEVLGQVVNQVPAGSTLCIFHNSALIYFPKKDRRKFGELQWILAEGASLAPVTFGASPVVVQGLRILDLSTTGPAAIGSALDTRLRTSALQDCAGYLFRRRVYPGRVSLVSWFGV